MKRLVKNLPVLIALILTVVEVRAQLNIGDKAPDFTLKDVDGNMVSLSDYANAKGIIVVFTCNTCPYAKAYENRIIKLDNMYAERGFPVIAINPNDPDQQPGDTYAAMQEKAADKDFPFPYLKDQTQQVAKAYGATRTPHVFLLSADRSIAYIGAIDNNYRSDDPGNAKYVEDAIRALLAGESVQKDRTKAIGCAIKWK